LSDARQIVIIDMAFNLGLQGLLNFRNMIEALEKEDYDEASNQIIRSKAADQLPDRYHKLAFIMKTDSL